MEPRRAGSDKIKIWEILILVAGVAVGCALWLRGGPGGGFLMALMALLGGLSLAGPPILLLSRRGKRWRAGRIQWFAQGTSAWLLWPPIARTRWNGPTNQMGPGSSAEICYLYGSPLMAVFMTSALLAGGWLGFRKRRGRKVRPLAWDERVGLLLGLAWACTGLWVLAMVYRDDFK